MTVLNLNIGLLGHVDSGKTSIAKLLSTNSSTACFDKDPQSRERGITIDLGFSSFVTDIPKNLVNLGKWEKLQFTLVDCPGHASLIKTVIGGSQIIDITLLVVDVVKGMQTQTAECLVIAEITKKPLLVVLNKVDLIEESKRQFIIEKVRKKMHITLANTIFKDCPVIPLAADPADHQGFTGGQGLIEALERAAYLPPRELAKPLLMFADHCFSIRGKGTIITGTILQGCLKVGDTVEIPSLHLTKKIKSLQIYHRNVEEGRAGDRLGLCVTQFDPKLLERGLVTSPGTVSPILAAIVSVERVRHFKGAFRNKAKFHLTVGYETVLGVIHLFGSPHPGFDPEREYAALPSAGDPATDPTFLFALIEFEKPVLASSQTLLIASKLDLDVHDKVCRLAFHGNLLVPFPDRTYPDYLSKLKIYKEKEKVGNAIRVVNKTEIIGQHMFKKETNMEMFSKLKVELSTGETGVLLGSFGTSGKMRIVMDKELSDQTAALISRKSDLVKIILRFKKYVFDKNKRVVQA